MRGLRRRDSPPVRLAAPLTGVDGRPGDRAPPQAEEHKWGSTEVAESLSGKFDVILCSDLLFDPACWPGLLSSLSTFGGPRTIVYLAHRLRNPLELGFFERLEGGCEAGGVAGGGYRCTPVPPEDEAPDGHRASPGQGGGGCIWRRSMFPDVSLYKLTRVEEVVPLGEEEAEGKCGRAGTGVLCGRARASCGGARV